MDMLDPIRSAEQRVREETYASFGEETAVLDDALGLIHSVLGQVGELALDHTFLQALLASRAAGSLRCAWLSAAVGYRTQGLTLERAALEDYATAAWVQKHPEDAELWLWEIADNVPRPDRYPPRPKEMFDNIAEDDPQLARALNSAYGYFSEAAHPRAPGLQWNVQWGAWHPSGTKQAAELRPVFDAPATASCLHFLLVLAASILDVAVGLYAEVQSEAENLDDGFQEDRTLMDERILSADRRLLPWVSTEPPERVS